MIDYPHPVRSGPPAGKPGFPEWIDGQTGEIFSGENPIRDTDHELALALQRDREEENRWLPN